ncbi:MAG TPA: hypothetical protein VMD58_01750 [Acidobacteriaceae bacterium]|nr:hypothetical protein [Acidobacteriaceae bacterium]
MARALIMTLLFSAGAFAQTAPVLRTRSNAPEMPPVKAAQGYSTLPASASGEYELDSKGSVVQITIQDKRLTGYVTKIEGDAALTLFFNRTSIEGSRISFTTQAVHNLHYAFTGEIVRGRAAGPDQPGFYRMIGKLTEYHGGQQERKQVHLKSTPRVL